MKNLLKMLSNFGGRAEAVPAAAVINLAAFGKHPGWDDHIPGIGLETESLAHLKQAFYVTGIGAQIDSGAWEKLEPGKRVDGYAHTFLWRREGHLLLGRLWSSTDRKGRAKYPMIVCADSTGISPGRLLANAGKELDQLQNTCRGFTTAEPVVAACQSSQERLRGQFEFVSKTEDAEVIPMETRRSFLETAQFGDRKVGLLRILHELGGLRAGGPAERRSCHLRVPAIGHAQDQIFRLWLEFFHCAIPTNVPLMLILRDGVEWLDVIVGEPAGEEFFCLQAAPLASPLSTQIPYELKPELEAQLQKITAAFLGSPAAVSSEDPKQMPPAALPEAGRGSGESPSSPRGGKLPVVLLVLAILMTAIAGWFFFLPRRPAAPAASPARLVSTPLPSPAKDESQPKYETAMKQARDALQQRQFETAIAGATAALAIKSNDPAALALQNQARQQSAAQAAEQKREADFSAALKAGQSALGEKNYDEALKQAQAALAFKSNDPAASDLLAQASRDQKMAQDNLAYTQALKSAQSAFQQQQYETAIAKAKAALAIKPDDAAALDIQNQALRQLTEETAARQQQDQFNMLLKTGQAAFDQGDYATAAGKAEAALNLMPESAAARTLRAAAKKQAGYAVALSAGQAALKRSDYDEAMRQAVAALAVNPAGAEALKLKADAFAGMDLPQVQALMGKADYAAALDLCNKHPGEPAFTALADRIRQAELQQIDDQLETYQVWFGLLSQSAAKSAQARAPEQKKKAQEIQSSNFSEQSISYYTDLVGKLEGRLNALHQLDARRAEVIARLKKKINEHS